MKSRILTLVFSLYAVVTVFAGIAIAQNPVPHINQPLVPDAVGPGAAGFTLTVNGSGFVSGAVVNWNGSPLVTTFVSSSRLTGSVPASNIAKAGTASVTVVNPAPGGGTSNVIFFDVSLPTFPVALNRTDYGTGGRSQPTAVAVGDFNEDGKLDLAVADANNKVTILLGKGDGTFERGVHYATQTGPEGVIVSDFNGDGKLDVATANYDSNSVSILLGKGNGRFQAALNFAAGYGSYRVAAGDFNGDGKLDLAVTNIHDNTVSILLGNGDGTFQPHVDYLAGLEPIGVATGDFNRDGKLDLAIADGAANTVSILLGNGDGTFQPPVSYVTGAQPLDLAVGDFNGDGKLDLAVTNGSDGTVSILLGSGDGTFQPHTDYAAGAGPYMVATADIDADGNLDLAVPNSNDGTVSILLGNGDGTFEPAYSFAAGNFPLSIALGDFNGDGRLDLVVAKQLDKGVAVFLQDGTITVAPTSFKFGGQLVGIKSAARTATLTNNGTDTLTISGIVLGGTNAADFAESNTCGSSLAPKAQCTISVTFTPSEMGPRTASITLTDSAPGSPQSIPVSGFGVTSGPNATLSATTLTFATQLLNTSSPAQVVMLSNYGTQALSISSIIASGDFSETNTCGSSLAVVATCTISVIFKPTQTGARTGTLSITDNAPASPQTISLQGTSTAVELNPGNLNFGYLLVGSSETLSTTVTNVANVPLNISNITLTGSGYFSQTNNCPDPGQLGAGASCTITVIFKPLQVGSYSANIAVSDDGGLSPQQVNLTGSGYKITCRKGCACVSGKCLGKGCSGTCTSGPMSSTRIGALVEEIASRQTCNAKASDWLTELEILSDLSK